MGATRPTAPPRHSVMRPLGIPNPLFKRENKRTKNRNKGSRLKVGRLFYLICTFAPTSIRRLSDVYPTPIRRLPSTSPCASTQHGAEIKKNVKGKHRRRVGDKRIKAIRGPIGVFDTLSLKRLFFVARRIEIPLKAEAEVTLAFGVEDSRKGIASKPLLVQMPHHHEDVSRLPLHVQDKV